FEAKDVSVLEEPDGSPTNRHILATRFGDLVGDVDLSSVRIEAIHLHRLLPAVDPGRAHEPDPVFRCLEATQTLGLDWHRVADGHESRRVHASQSHFEST